MTKFDSNGNYIANSDCHVTQSSNSLSDKDPSNKIKEIYDTANAGGNYIFKKGTNFFNFNKPIKQLTKHIEIEFEEWMIGK